MNALTLGLVAAVCWALHDTTIRYLSRTTPMMAALLTVLFFGLVFQSVVIVAQGAEVAVTGRAFWLSVGAGVAFLVASVGLYFAFQRGPVRLVSPIIAAYPILSIAFALAKGAQITGLQVLAILAIIAGVAIVAAQHSDEPVPPMAPTIALAVLSATGFATSFYLGQSAAELAGELPSTLITRIVAFGLLGGALLILRQPLWPGRRSLLPLMLMGILDGIALLAVLSAGPLPNPEYAAVTASMFGLLTVLLAWVFLGEAMSPAKWLGVLIAFTGVGYLAW